MKVTQKLIARRAGVSQPAVSMILKGEDESFPVETRDRVRSVARKLGYTVRTRATGNLGLIVPDYYSTGGAVNRRFYGRFLDGAMGRARDLGVHILLETASYRGEVPDMVTASKVDGLILAAPTSPARVKRLQSHMPVVFLNTKGGRGTATSVMPDNSDGIERAVRLLCEADHRHIAFFGIEPHPITDHLRERRDAFSQSIRTLGLDPKKCAVYMPKEKSPDHSDQMDITARVVDRLMKLTPRPTAVISHGDGVILGFIAIARERGWLCPDHFSAIGFDNTDNCSYSRPELTSVDQPMEEMGAAAVDELVAHIRDPERAIRQLRLECRIQERASVRRVK